MAPFAAYIWVIITIPASSTIRKITYLTTDTRSFMKKVYNIYFALLIYHIQDSICMDNICIFG